MKLSMQDFLGRKITGSCGRLHVWKTLVQPKTNYLEMRWDTLNCSIRRKTLKTSNEILLFSWWNASKEVPTWAGDAEGWWGQAVTQISGAVGTAPASEIAVCFLSLPLRQFSEETKSIYTCWGCQFLFVYTPEDWSDPLVGLEFFPKTSVMLKLQEQTSDVTDLIYIL